MPQDNPFSVPVLILTRSSTIVKKELVVTDLQRILNTLSITVNIFALVVSFFIVCFFPHNSYDCLGSIRFLQ